MIRSGFQQIIGVAGQVVFAAPTVVISIMLARTDSVLLIAPLAIAFGVVNVAFTLFSFGLRSYLSLWAFQKFSSSTFLLNRFLGVCFAAISSALFLNEMGISAEITALALLVKSSDAIMDIKFGIELATASVHQSFRRFLQTGILRLMVLVGLFVLMMNGFDKPLSALIASSAIMFLLTIIQVWSRFVTAINNVRLSEVADLVKDAVPLSIAAVVCSVLTAIPRGTLDILFQGQEAGFAGVTLIVGTIFGMVFNTLWIRSAVEYREHGMESMVRRFMLEGAGLGVILLGGLFLVDNIIAFIYGITDPSFQAVFRNLSSVLILFFFAMSSANLLKVCSSARHESFVYVLGILAYIAGVMTAHDMIVALIAASVIMMVSVLIGISYAVRSR